MTRSQALPAHAGRLTAGVLLAVALSVSGCTGAPDAGTVPARPAATSESTDPATPTATPSPTTAPEPASTPGEPFAHPYYPPGTSLAVVGVAHDGTLDVRRGPGTTFPVVGTLDPLAEGVVVVSDQGWLSEPPGIWLEVTASGVSGWVNSRFLGGRAGTEDVTASLVQQLGGRPTADSMAELGRIVATASASTDPPSAVVMSAAPTAGDLHEVQYDVVGLGDDSVHAVRLHVFGRPSGSGFQLVSVESTSFCARGGSGGELCP